MNYKTLIAPFISVIAIVLQLVFDLELSQELQSEVAGALANLVAVGFVIYGIVHNHFKDETK